ncbi:hypothetical protein V6N13_083278 [Hibiscus sabdariffa]
MAMWWTPILRRNSVKRRRRFGFVQFKSKADATRVIERLNGFSLYGSRLLVKMAEFERKNGEGVDRNSARMCKKYHKDFNNHELGGGTGMNYNNEGGSNERRNKKRIIGHSEEEDLWNLRSCLVGTTATVCSVSSIESRLTNWGLGEIKVQRLGGKSFLLTIKDEDLFLMLENLEWSYLKEIFLSVEIWSDKALMNIPRATWIKIHGVPLSCWNQVTLTRLAEIWGSFEALGENGNRFHNCDDVEELGFSDNPIKKLDADSLANKVDPEASSSEYTAESTSKSSLASENLILEEEEDDALNAILMSKDGSAGCNFRNETGSFLGEMELVGKGNVAPQKLISLEVITNQGEIEGLDQVKSPIQMLANVKSSWVDVVKEVLDYSRGSKDSEPVKGLGVTESRAAGPCGAKTNLIHSSGPCLRSVGPSLNERPLDRIEVLNQKSKGSQYREKRFGSLWEIQDQVLTDQEKRKKVKACKKLKINRSSLANFEVSGQSLSDFDLSFRRGILSKEARKILRLGKKLESLSAVMRKRLYCELVLRRLGLFDLWTVVLEDFIGLAIAGFGHCAFSVSTIEFSREDGYEIGNLEY